MRPQSSSWTIRHVGNHRSARIAALRPSWSHAYDSVRRSGRAVATESGSRLPSGQRALVVAWRRPYAPCYSLPKGTCSPRTAHYGWSQRCAHGRMWVRHLLLQRPERSNGASSGQGRAAVPTRRRRPGRRAATTSSQAKSAVMTASGPDHPLG